MADLQKIVDELSGLTVLEAADLAKAARRKVGRLGRGRCRGCTGRKRVRKFLRITSRKSREMPNLIEVQKASYSSDNQFLIEVQKAS
jgi:hypothetical protein